MSEFHVEVVRVGPVTKHPNADTLSITNIHGGYPVIMRTGVFDAMDSRSRRYFDADDFYALASGLRLTVAPPLYRGPWSWDLVSHADGMSVVDPTHIREGFVVRPVKERVDERLGRVILKMHGEAFLTRGKAGG